MPEETDQSGLAPGSDRKNLDPSTTSEHSEPKSKIIPFNSHPDGNSLADISPQSINANGTSLESIYWRVLMELKREFFIGRDHFENILPYIDGVYRRVPTEWVRDQVFKKFLSLGQSGWGVMLYNSKLTMELMEKLRLGTPFVDGMPPDDEINCLNGIVNARKNIFIQHHPGWYSTVQLPITYDPKAKCPAWDKVISQWFPADCIGLAWEVIGACMIANSLNQQAIWLRGGGGNGKSTFLMAVQQLIGNDNAFGVGIDQLVRNNWAVGMLQGKLLMFDMDTPIEALNHSSKLKQIISGDPMFADFKHKSPGNIKPCCKVILAGNCGPDSTDDSFGFTRRFVIVPFDSNIPAGQARNQAEILRELAAERSGALNKALGGLQSLFRHGRFSQPPSVAAVMKVFEESRDHIGQFVFSSQVVIAEDAEIPKAELVEAYNKWARKNRKAQKDAATIGQWLGKTTTEGKLRVVPVRRGGRGPNRFWSYSGIRLRTQEDVVEPLAGSVDIEDDLE